MADIFVTKSYTFQNQMVSLQKQVENLQNQISRDKKAYQLLETEVQKIDTIIISLEESFVYLHAKQDRMANTNYPTKMAEAVLAKHKASFSVEKEKYFLNKMYDIREQKKKEMGILASHINTHKQQVIYFQDQKHLCQLQMSKEQSDLVMRQNSKNKL